MTLNEIKINYEAEEISIEEPILLININNLYHKKITDKEMYEAIRKSWRIDLNRVKNIKIACSIYKGIIREVFIIEGWNDANENGRKEFFGKKAHDEIRNKYIDKSVKSYWKQGSQNPIKYANPKL